MGTTQHSLQPYLAQYASCTMLADCRTSAASSVQGTVVVVGAGAGERGTGLIPGKGTGVIRRGEAEGAGALQPVLQTEVEER